MPPPRVRASRLSSKRSQSITTPTTILCKFRTPLTFVIHFQVCKGLCTLNSPQYQYTADPGRTFDKVQYDFHTTSTPRTTRLHRRQVGHRVPNARRPKDAFCLLFNLARLAAAELTLSLQTLDHLWQSTETVPSLREKISSTFFQRPRARDYFALHCTCRWTYRYIHAVLVYTSVAFVSPHPSRPVVTSSRDRTPTSVTALTMVSLPLRISKIYAYLPKMTTSQSLEASRSLAYGWLEWKPELLRSFRGIGTLEMRANGSDFYLRPHNLTRGEYYQYLKRFFMRYVQDYDGDPPAPMSVGHLLMGDGSFDYHPAAVLAVLSIKPSAITILDTVPIQLLVSSVFFQDVAQNLEHLTIIIVPSTNGYAYGDTIWGI